MLALLVAMPWFRKSHPRAERWLVPASAFFGATNMLSHWSRSTTIERGISVAEAEHEQREDPDGSFYRAGQAEKIHLASAA
jgi:hypothetical protein